MAKVTGPLFSVDARGKIGDSLVFMGWRGLKTVRSYVIPSNPQTEEQMRVRDNFSMAVSMWGNLTGLDQQAWRMYASGQPYSGFNGYVGLVKNQLDASNVWVDIKQVEVTSIDAESATIGGVTSSDVDLMIRYGTSSTTMPNSVVVTPTAGEENDYTFSETLTGLNADTTYYFMIETVGDGEIYGRTGIYDFSTTTG